MYRVDDVYGIGVGDMIVKHSDFISTDVPITKTLLNFTYTNDLSNPDSLRYQQYEEAFCDAVSYDCFVLPVWLQGEVKNMATALPVCRHCCQW